MGLARSAASRAIVFREEADDEAGRTVSALRTTAFGDGALRLAQMAVAGEAFDREDFLAGKRGE